MEIPKIANMKNAENILTRTISTVVFTNSSFLMFI